MIANSRDQDTEIPAASTPAASVVNPLPVNPPAPSSTPAPINSRDFPPGELTSSTGATAGLRDIVQRRKFGRESVFSVVTKSKPFWKPAENLVRPKHQRC